MTADPNIALPVLHALNIVVFNRISPRKYEIYGNVPDFYRKLFSSGEALCTSPWEYSHMLDFFLDDAELFFERNLPGSISSGIWQEFGLHEEEQALTATALAAEGRQILILRLLGDDFVDRARILQKAREHLLERRMLHRDLADYKLQSRFDAASSLHGRSFFLEALNEEVGRAAASGYDLSLLLIDIDDFKDINEHYGPLAGDGILASFGQLLRSSLRREDLAARYGGEEFAVLAPFTNNEQAARMAEKLRSRVEGHSFSGVPAITVSIGCTAHLPGERADSLIQRADLALYEAKRSGKNLVRIR